LQRRTSLKSFWGLYVVLGALAALIWVAGFVYDLTPVSRSLIVLIGFVPLLVGIVYSWLVRINTEYRLFQDSLEIESGIVSRRIENIQLFRVRDLGLVQSILNRVAGVGDVIVTSTDQTAPLYRLRGVADPQALYGQLRELVSKSQATRRTMIVEEER
jgi:uncharacterized membrane protein YdbT with pleckstrin-like domain